MENKKQPSKGNNSELDLDIDAILSGTGSKKSSSGSRKASNGKKQPSKGSGNKKQSSGSRKKTASSKSGTKKRSTKGKKNKNSYALKHLSSGRIVWSVVVCTLFTCLLCFICYGCYMRYIKYPKQEPVVSKLTGMYCLNDWMDSVHSLDGYDGGYLNQELTYANGADYKEEFLKRVASTVKYTPNKVDGVNVYGNKLRSSKTDEVVKVDSTVEEGESVKLTYIDWSKLKFDKKVLKTIMKDLGVKYGCTDYPSKLVEVFCRYFNSLEKVPVKTVDYVPNMVKNSDGTYSMKIEEDIILDRLLFSSKSFQNTLTRFSVTAGGVNNVNPSWTKWNKLSKEEKKGKKQPKKWLSKLQPTKEWSKWNKLSKKEKKSKKEPTKYNWKGLIRKDWCGAYYLQKEYIEYDSKGNAIKTPIKAQIGDGTFENPAGLDTEVMTYIFKSEKNKKGKKVDKKYPIKVKLVEYGVSQDAITWIEGKDERNRGIDLKSEVQYVYYIFEITNMSNKKLTIKDNSTLCDRNANITSRTGKLYSIKSSITLEPDKSGRIESWSRSTELNKQYLIWGKDFDRRLSPVWFRVLAGDIDNPDESKGVTLNTTRTDDTDSSSEEDEYTDDSENSEN